MAKKKKTETEVDTVDTENTEETQAAEETGKRKNKPRDPSNCAKRLAVMVDGSGELVVQDLGTKKEANNWVEFNIEGGVMDYKDGINTMVDGNQCVLVIGKIPVVKKKTVATI